MPVSASGMDLLKAEKAIVFVNGEDKATVDSVMREKRAQAQGGKT